MEIAGIPTVTLGYSDQLNYFRNVALANGCPNIRWVSVPRIGHAEEMVATYYENVVKALTSPLTVKEKEAGLYVPPTPARVIFEGTIDESQDFLQQTTLVENCRMCPIAKYTDGLPVIIPTEEAVAAMLTGTSHKPTESIVTQYPSMGWTGTTPAGAAITYAQSYTSTVEKAAICAVMAGCKPQYMPVVLAIANAGGNSTNCPGTSSMWENWYCVSGPIAKEIGMNAGQDSMDTGSPANNTLGRVGALMTVNFGGCITGLVRTDSGNPIHNVCFAEDLDASVFSEGWVGFNQENSHLDASGKSVKYTAQESVLAKGSGWGMVTGLFSFPGYYRSLNMGQMGLARFLGVEGTPGYYNWLEVVCPIIVRAMPRPASQCFILHMNLAQLLYDYGFKTKTDVYKWLYDNWTIDVQTYYKTGLFDFETNGGNSVEPTTGKTWNELIKTNSDLKIHVFGGAQGASANCILVGDSFGDEHWYYNVFGGKPGATPIDPWR